MREPVDALLRAALHRGGVGYSVVHGGGTARLANALRALGPYVFHRFLRRNYRQQRPPDANLDVVRALWGLQPPLVITTNYDSALRWGGPAEVQMVANDQHEELVLLAEATSDWPWIWHLHGTIERMATVILAGRDYKRLYENDERNRVASYERALFELQKTLATKSLLYVGFGLTDPYVLEQIAHVLELTRGSVAPSYALMKQGQGNRGDLWENYNVRLIEYAEHDMLAGLLGDISRQAFGAPAASPASSPQAAPASSPAPSPAPRTVNEVVSRSMDDDRPITRAGRGEDDGAAVRRPPSESGPELALSFEPDPAPEPPSTAKPVAADLLPMGWSMGGGAKPKSEQRKSPASQPAPAPVVAQKPIIERSQLVEELGRELLRGCRLLLLAPQGGGARRLAGQIAAAHFGTCVTWLVPIPKAMAPNAPCVDV